MTKEPSLLFSKKSLDVSACQYDDGIERKVGFVATVSYEYELYASSRKELEEMISKFEIEHNMGLDE